MKTVTVMVAITAAIIVALRRRTSPNTSDTRPFVPLWVYMDEHAQEAECELSAWKR